MISKNKAKKSNSKKKLLRFKSGYKIKKSVSYRMKKSFVKKKVVSVKMVGKKPLKAKAPAIALRAKVKYTLQKKFLASAAVRSFLIEMAGENAITVLREFSHELSDEELAQRAKMKVSDVRVVLNKLHNHGMAQYERSRDKDSGWYSYVWRIDEERGVEILTPVYDGQDYTIAKLSDEGSGDKYLCLVCTDKQIVSFENAVDCQFKCLNCGNDLSFYEKKKD